jgi:hypothetical protein
MIIKQRFGGQVARSNGNFVKIKALEFEGFSFTRIQQLIFSGLVADI